MDGGTKEARAARRAEWRGILEQQAASGLTAAGFCRERGIPAWKFSYWRAALRPRLSPPSRADSAGGFVELSVSARPGGGTGVWIEAGRWRLHVEPGFDAAALRRAAEALSAP
jgi:hypothetical protein